MATWSYKSQDPSIRHIGPMAQDFAEAFQVGEDSKHITTVDADGVALAAIQGLNEIVKERNMQLEAQGRDIVELRRQLNELQAQVRKLTQNPN